MPTKIEWAEETWSPVTGCTPVSEGCANCYAERLSRSFWKPWGYDPPPRHFEVRLHPDRLKRMPRSRTGRPVFVCSMGDLFHKDVPFAFIWDVWAAMAARLETPFAILTKRPERMLEFTQWVAGADHISIAEWPRNIWLGVTAENQARAEERIPVLLQIPAAVRFVSIEPMLGSVSLQPWLRSVTYDSQWRSSADGKLIQRPVLECHASLDQVICGGESGPGARPMNPEWPRKLRDQCVAAGVPFLFKSWGAWIPAETLCSSDFTLEAGDIGILDSVEPCRLEESRGRDKRAAGELTPRRLGSQRVHEWHCGYPATNSERFSIRVGKKAAGRLLDGRVWDEYPATAGMRLEA